MNNQFIKIGTKLDLEVINNLGQKQGKTYISQLIDVNDDNTLTILAPIYESRLIFIPTGARVKIVFINERGDLFSFEGLVTSKEKKDNMAFLLVNICSNMEKIQRRDYYRLSCCLDARYRIYQKPPEVSESTDVPPSPPSPYIRTVTRNISGGGLCLVTDQAYERGTLLDIQLDIDGQPIQAIGKLVRCSILETAKGHKYEIGLTYHSLDKKAQNMIVRYIFEQQKLLLKKNMDNR